jgi:hypothetical protein
MTDANNQKIWVNTNSVIKRLGDSPEVSAALESGRLAELVQCIPGFGGGLPLDPSSDDEPSSQRDLSETPPPSPLPPPSVSSSSSVAAPASEAKIQAFIQNLSELCKSEAYAYDRTRQNSDPEAYQRVATHRRMIINYIKNELPKLPLTEWQWQERLRGNQELIAVIESANMKNALMSHSLWIN